jgi:FAD/FMN-containing dehydrogenase
MVHLRHHRFADDRESDPHPNFASFWTTVKHTIIHVEKQLMQEYYDVWGDSAENRTAEARRAWISYATNILVLAVWLLILGPFFFGLIFLPANAIGALFIIHFNWVTHNGLCGSDFKPVNLDSGYFWFGNKIFAGIYMHENHHRRPHLFNPARADAGILSYSRLREARPSARIVPRDLREARAAIRRAEQEGRNLTFRAGGRSFDDQALNHDVVVDVSGFDRILSVDVERRELTVEPGARWGEVFAATVQHGLIPHILATTPGATAGGAISANVLSRSSPIYGHTGDHVLEVELMTPSGELLNCSRTDNADLFRAVISGFGYFGLLTRAKFELLEIGGKRRMHTEIDRFEGLDGFVEGLIDRSFNPADNDAVSSVFSLAEPQRGAVIKSRYTDEPLGNPFFLHEPYAWYRVLAEPLFMSSRLANAICHASYVHVFGKGPFIDDLRGYTFCMEGNERLKAAGDRFGVRMCSLQHSYIIPAESVRFFLDEATRIFRANNIYPALLDALYRPADDYLLSSSNGLPGFCVTFTFEGVTGSELERIHASFLELNDACISVGGRLHLTKNVYGTREQLRTMYGHAASELARLKALHDPKNVLKNDFFARVFG